MTMNDAVAREPVPPHAVPPDAVPPDAASAVPRRRVVQALGSLGLAGIVVTFVSGCSSVVPQSASAVAASAIANPSPQALDTIRAAITAGEVGVGQAKLLAAAGVILSRPTATTYRVFSTVCTHQGATITHLTADGKIECPLHGSTFNPITGAALIGPAGKPLAGREAALRGDTVALS